MGETSGGVMMKMPRNENTKSGIIQVLFMCRTLELKPRPFIEQMRELNNPLDCNIGKSKLKT